MLSLLKIRANYLLKVKILYKLFETYIFCITYEYMLGYLAIEFSSNSLLSILISIYKKKYVFFRQLKKTYLSKIFNYYKTCYISYNNYLLNYYELLCTYLNTISMYSNKLKRINTSTLLSNITNIQYFYFYVLYIKLKRMYLSIYNINTFKSIIINNKNNVFINTIYDKLNYIKLCNLKYKRLSTKKEKLFNMPYFVSNNKERINFYYKYNNMYIYFYKYHYRTKRYYIIYSYFVVLFNWYYFSKYDRLLRHQEWVLFGDYKKEVIKYHLT